MPKTNIYKIAVISTIVVISLVVITYLFSLYSILTAKSSNFTSNDSEIWSLTDTSKIVHYPLLLNDSLPHFQYKKIMDSIELIEKEKEIQKNKFGTGMKGNVIGYNFFEECDNCQDTREKSFMEAGKKNQYYADSIYTILKTKKHLTNLDSAYYDSLIRSNFSNLMEVDQNKIYPKKYFLFFSGYTLANNCYFKIDSGKYFLKYPVWDNIIRVKNNMKDHNGHFETKEIPFRYLEKENAILFPITRKQFIITKNTLTVFYIIVAVYSFFIILFLPLKILLSISKGIVFTRHNIKYLFLIAYSFLGLSLILPVATFLIRMAFNIYKLSEFNYNYWSLIWNNYPYLLIGFVVLGIAKGFNRGYQIQQEQDLTV